MAIDIGGIKYPSQQWYNENVLTKGRESVGGREIPISSNRVLSGGPEEQSTDIGNVSGLTSGVSNDSSYKAFGSKLMDILARYQGLSTSANYPYEEASLNLQEEQAGRIMKEATPGMSPSLQGKVRSAESEALEPSITGLKKRHATFLDQIKAVGTALEQTMQFGEYLHGLEMEDKDLAMKILTTPSLLKSAQRSQDTLKWMGKTLGVKPDFLMSVIAEEEETKPNSYKEWELAGGSQGTGKTYAQWLDKENDISTFDDILQAAINEGALPEEAARAAQFVAENQGLQLSLEDVERMKVRASKMNKSVLTPPTTTDSSAQKMSLSTIFPFKKPDWSIPSLPSLPPLSPYQKEFVGGVKQDLGETVGGVKSFFGGLFGY